MRTNALILLVYTLLVLVFLAVTNGNFAAVGVFLILFNTVVGAGAVARCVPIMGCQVDESIASCKWYSNISSLITFTILCASLFQYSDYFEGYEFILLFFSFLFFSLLSKYMSASMCRLMMNKGSGSDR